MKKLDPKVSSLIRTLTAVALFCLAPYSLAVDCQDLNGYCAPSGAPNVQVKGRIESIMFGADRPVQFILENQPTFHRFCDISRFGSDDEVIIDTLKNAKMLNQEVVVSYSNFAGCSSGFPRVWAVGLE